MIRKQRARSSKLLSRADRLPVIGPGSFRPAAGPIHDVADQAAMISLRRGGLLAADSDAFQRADRWRAGSAMLQETENRGRVPWREPGP